MKKIFGFIIFLLAMVAGWSFFFLPSSTPVVANMAISAPAARVYSFMANQRKWSRWWPVPGSENAQSFQYNGNDYSVAAETGNIIEITTKIKDSLLNGRMYIAPVLIDSTAVEWTIHLNSGSNIINRIRTYFTAGNLQKDMSGILFGLKKFAEKQDNIYGMFIEKTKVTDTVLVATHGFYSHYPSTQDIYTLVEKLRVYITKEKATETNAPMVNIQPADSTQYKIMVAIPTNRLLTGKGDIELKRMVNGNIIWGEVRGGPYTVIAALENLENYRHDYRLSSPAIPFASLITDRRKEPDTAKWITRVYYPIF